MTYKGQNKEKPTTLTKANETKKTLPNYRKTELQCGINKIYTSKFFKNIRSTLYKYTVQRDLLNTNT